LRHGQILSIVSPSITRISSSVLGALRAKNPRRSAAEKPFWGVPPTQVAEWAGHSVEVLLKIYAKCLDGGTAALRDRIEGALGLPAIQADPSVRAEATQTWARPRREQP